MNDCNCGDRRVSDREHDALTAMISFEETCHPRDRPGDVVILQGAQEFFSGSFLFGSKARILSAMLTGQHARRCPCRSKFSSRSRRLRLLFRTSMMTLVSSR